MQIPDGWQRGSTPLPTALVNDLSQARRIGVLRLEGVVFVDLDGHVAPKVVVRGRDGEARILGDVVLVGLCPCDLLLLQPVELVVRDVHVHGNVGVDDHFDVLGSGRGGGGCAGIIRARRGCCRLGRGEELVFLGTEAVPPGAILVDEIGVTQRGRAILEREQHRHVRNGLVGVIHFDGSDRIRYLPVIREPVVLGEPLLLGERAPGLRVQVIVGVPPVPHGRRLVISLRCRAYLIPELLLGLDVYRRTLRGLLVLILDLIFQLVEAFVHFLLFLLAHPLVDQDRLFLAGDLLLFRRGIGPVEIDGAATSRCYEGEKRDHPRNELPYRSWPVHRHHQGRPYLLYHPTSARRTSKIRAPRLLPTTDSVHA